MPVFHVNRNPSDIALKMMYTSYESLQPVAAANWYNIAN